MPIDPPPHWEPKALRAKLEAGADFVQTQFCMDVAVAGRYARRLLDHGGAQRLPILIGVAAVPSAPPGRRVRGESYRTPLSRPQGAPPPKARRSQSEGEPDC